MDNLIAQIAAEQGFPEDLVRRSAQARAQEQGVSVEDIIRQWAGGEAAGAAPAAAAPEPEAEPTAAGGTPQAEPAEKAAPAPSGPEVEVLAPAEPAAAQVTPDDTEAPPGPRSVLAGFPRWLAAAFVVIPMIAVLYALLAPDGPDCGVSGQLALDPVTGEAENCDGTEYGVVVLNLFSMGEELYVSKCAACHGAGGGGGAGQVLAGGAVLASFPAGQCATHIEWVALGTAAWPDPTYGALNKPVGGFGNMPGFGSSLTPEEIAAVSLYERVAFGGEALPEAEADCTPVDAAVTAAP
jgi:mono/diheme cytochrome c family protein